MAGEHGEPWKVRQWAADDGLPYYIGLVDARDEQVLAVVQDSDDDEAFIDRIAACVNACQDISDDKLAGGVVALEDVRAAVKEEVLAVIAYKGAPPHLPVERFATLVQEAVAARLTPGRLHSSG